MLVSVEISQTPTADHLIKTWALRYAPDISPLAKYYEGSPVQALQVLATAKGRAATVAKLKKSLVELNSEMAGVQTSRLYQKSPNMTDFNEARQLKIRTSEVYHQLLQLYLEHGKESSELLHSNSWMGQNSAGFTNNLIPNVRRVAEIIEPTLMLFQGHFTSCKDWRALGTLTTQLNFTNNLLLPRLTPAEQVLIAPFFRLIEEQVSIPWQRVCAAAARYHLESPEFILVKKLLSEASEIAEVVYKQIVKAFPHHLSRRGNLTAPDITHSCLRDIYMYQAYLWLCLLQGHLQPIEQELVPLCLMVLPQLEVKWELLDRSNVYLSEELLRRLNSQQKSLLKPYTDGLIAAFRRSRAEFETPPNQMDTSKLKDLIQIKGYQLKPGR